LLIGVAPIVNLEWIQKIHRDMELRGYSVEVVTQTILRRMHDYVHYITPQFSRTHINFQRVPTVDTSNPFAAERHTAARRELRGHTLRAARLGRAGGAARQHRHVFHLASRHHRGARRRNGASMHLILTPRMLNLLAERCTTRSRCRYNRALHMSSGNILGGLNPQQREAVTLPQESALILAGAGSGKTRVLTTRIAWLIQTGRSVRTAFLPSPSPTRRRARCSHAFRDVADQHARMWVGTFHGCATACCALIFAQQDCRRRFRSSTTRISSR
jgi:hypothetical protein